MSEKPIVLAGMLKAVGNVDMDKFIASLKERLKFQKTVYLLEVFGFDLGYQFRFYIYGPYSTTAADAGYELAEAKNFNEMPKVEFIDENVKKRFDELLKFLGSNKDDPHWLELIASIHYLKHIKLNNEETKKIILAKSSGFKEEEYLNGLEYLKTSGLIG